MAFPAWLNLNRERIDGSRAMDIETADEYKGNGDFTIDDRSLNASNLRTLTRRSLTEARTYSRIYFCDHSHRKHQLTLVSLSNVFELVR